MELWEVALYLKPKKKGNNEYKSKFNHRQLEGDFELIDNYYIEQGDWLVGYKRQYYDSRIKADTGYKNGQQYYHARAYLTKQPKLGELLELHKYLKRLILEFMSDELDDYVTTYENKRKALEEEI